MPNQRISNGVSERQLVGALRAVKGGDFSVRMPIHGTGAETAKAFNDVVELLESSTRELERISQAVGKEGKITQRASLPAASGDWAARIDFVNSLIEDLVQPAVEVARVMDAVAKGDLSQRMALATDGKPLQGEFLRIGRTVNSVVEQLSSFASEVTRVAREVGTEGKLGGQAVVPGVAGTWKDLTDSVNSMAANLTSQVRNIADVTTAVAKGDLSKKITVDVKGEILQLKDTINTMVDQLNSFASEVTRVAREVGTEGSLGGQAAVPGVAGIWKDLTDNVNSMAANLTSQVRNIAEVTTSVANGDLSKKITVNVKGEILELKNTINTMVDQLNSFASEVTRVAREVGSEGKLGGQADVRDVSGTWRDLTDSVNSMAANLTSQVRNIADVTTAVARGDLSKKITVDVRGEILELKNTINTMVGQLGSFASEVTRVAREVGTDGKLGGQAVVKGVGGTWKDLTDNVNSMAANLTSQVRNIADVTTAVARGDLSRKITVDVRGEILELKNTINTMVDQLNSFASEVTRVAREVGTDGQLGGQAVVRGVAGTWKDLTDSVNSMAANLTGQVRNIAEVTTAVANGDLSKKITVRVRGEILRLKRTINTMVDQLGSFASEVTRVAREVGTEGKLGGQAAVPGVAGTWKDLTDNVNSMAANLTNQVRNIADVTTSVAKGDLSKKITVDVKGEILELKNTMNTMVDQLGSFASEVTRVAREVGTEGKLGGQAEIVGAAGIWKDLTDNVNSMAANLTNQVRNIADVTTAVARGDLSKKITVDVRGEILELKNTINTMVDQLNSFASEVTRVAREVGTEGNLGGQATVPGVAGIWKDLTDNTNMMAANLTAQVRGIAQVVTAVAHGNLKRKLTLQSQGEIAALANTINEMGDTLATFADQVTTVAREVGVEGKLGGQASVPGAAGTWKDLTDNVNQLAANLTTQVRAIAEVATAVTKGDLTRSIAVKAQGEVASLKDNINEMIGNLRDTTQKNTEQDWLKTNLAKFSRMLQGQKDLMAVANLILSELARVVTAHHGVFYLAEPADGSMILKLVNSYAYQERKKLANRFAPGEGLVGQCALEKQRLLLTEVPDDYIKVSSGLGEAPPRNIVVLPVLFEKEVKAVVELASLNPFTPTHLAFLDQLAESIGIVLNTIAATTRTEELLKQSQSLTEELQVQQEELKESNKRLEQQATSLKASEELLKEQQEELKQTNEELEEKALQLMSQKAEVEAKNREIELTKLSLQERAEQLALTSKYKSEFLANMSHELRTPLNSLLLLAEMLAENTPGNLHPKQVEFAKTIYAAGSDLQSLINDILDMAKIESGTMTLDLEELPFSELQQYVERTFLPVAQNKGIDFTVELAADLPATIYSDAKRLQQVLRNLLSNAFKFTEQGKVSLSVTKTAGGWSSDQEALNRADTVIALAVTDTGIGIPADQLKIIFEPFQQADSGVSRKYGGTGLGLSISREIARLLGGEIRVRSVVGQGSTFTLYLPARGDQRGSKIEDRMTTKDRDNPQSSFFYPRSSLADPRLAAEAGSTIDGRGSKTETKPPPSSMVEPGTAVAAGQTREEVEDDRKQIQPGDRVLLIVENDPNFARVLLHIAREQGFKGVVAQAGHSALLLAQQCHPDAITLDIRLPDMDGWKVLEHFKNDLSTRHIPIHIISVVEAWQRCLQLGALAYLKKPVNKQALAEAFAKIQSFVERGKKNLLLVETDEAHRAAMVELIGDGDVHITAVGTAEEALKALKTTPFDCLVINLWFPDMTGFELVNQIQKKPELRNLPIIIYTGKDLSPEEEAQLKVLAEGTVIKDCKSPEHLLDETCLFLHRVEANLPESKRRILRQIHEIDPVLANRKVLIVDDDLRNIFALTSMLEHHGMHVLYAENGQAGIDILEKTPDVDLVLMDIMMPGMDGYETMRAIRRMERFQSLPIIALTAKAMKGDREKCIEAGASDYIAKPVKSEQVLSLLRVWLYR
jgi:HAMP domain-containing protein/signal transduction histidine kinase/CheY-like chemotaxis protein